MDEQNRKPKYKFVSLHVKLLIGFTLVFSLVFALAYLWFYNFATQRAMERIEADLVDTLDGAAARVDIEQFVALAEEGVPREDDYTDDPRYWNHVQWLATVEQIEPRAKVYTYVKGEKPNEVIFIGSGGAVLDPPFGAKFKEHYISSGPLIAGLSGPLVDPTLWTDQWGSWGISGYKPLKNAQGEKVGGIGIDFEADYVIRVQQAIRDKVVIAFGITYATLFALVFLVSGGLTRPIVALTRAAERIGEGDYEQDLSHLSGGRLHDEISTLAEVFEIMVSKVYQREQTLIRQVEELRIEIDEVKRKKQVSEIVESDFFQDLQSKARRMRSRHRTQDALGDETP
jgi:methyl-accepting chemotaxis protein